MYKTPELSLKAYAYAHNEYLELLATQGLLGTALVLVFLKLWQAIGRRRDPLLQGILFGALGGSLSLLIHAVAEFHFHIPANAALFFVLLALGLAAGVVPGGNASSRCSKSRHRRSERTGIGVAPLHTDSASLNSRPMNPRV